MTEIEKLNAEILSLHRKLSASELEVGNYKQRYEASNIKYLAKEKELMELKYPEPPKPPETRTYDNFHKRMQK